ncbi:hypothetical protein DLAC_11516 [Tieghemostelium lacteum]|uniref:Transmembrane protein n=1 Tax=Tieghemostelium lacteum TaxID=361077 RepID=A0A152A4C4_TIELA|nr:hypothetical protein DLAC_11516 [Tieghemostelium lacteum]|eukprot:KYR01064.1 hypothetical protein DLAC_11516 [Tieghemostelium lacteum]
MKLLLCIYVFLVLIFKSFQSVIPPQPINVTQYNQVLVLAENFNLLSHYQSENGTYLFCAQYQVERPFFCDNNNNLALLYDN